MSERCYLHFSPHSIDSHNNIDTAFKKKLEKVFFKNPFLTTFCLKRW